MRYRLIDLGESRSIVRREIRDLIEQAGMRSRHLLSDIDQSIGCDETISTRVSGLNNLTQVIDELAWWLRWNDDPRDPYVEDRRDAESVLMLLSKHGQIHRG